MLCQCPTRDVGDDGHCRICKLRAELTPDEFAELEDILGHALYEALLDEDDTRPVRLQRHRGRKRPRKEKE